MGIQNLSRTVGLWLAEGSTTSKSELTFTNNQPELIRFFHKVIFENLQPKHNPRIYVYRRNKNVKIKLPIKNILYRYYIHTLSNQPFFIYRISGVELMKKWLNLVEIIKGKTNLYKFILQGFFAGEGNIKYIVSSHSRVLRVSQGKPNEFIEKIFKNLNLNFVYMPSERSYVISGRENLEKLWKLEISKLHPIKHKKFHLMLESYKQRHFKKGQLKLKIINMVNVPRTSQELSKLFNKSQSRVSRILSQLKNQGLVNEFRVRSISYWINSKHNIVIISNTKSKILKFLNEPKKVYEISKHSKVSWKSSFKRLKELERLNLVRHENNLWYKVGTDKEVMVL